jgi:hypothetical protein
MDGRVTPDTRRAKTAPTVSALKFETTQQGDFRVNLTSRTDFLIGIAIGFSIACAIWPY